MTLYKLPDMDALPSMSKEAIDGFCAITFKDGDWHAHIVGGSVIGVTFDFLELAEHSRVFTDDVGLLHLCNIICRPIGISEADLDVILYRVIGEIKHGSTTTPPAAA